MKQTRKSLIGIECESGLLLFLLPLSTKLHTFYLKKLYYQLILVQSQIFKKSACGGHFKFH